ncbi:MAG: flavodoxin [Candidatus Hadarchaeales archaeon]
MKSLVVYYSRTGNTRFVAETIAAKLKAEIEEIIDKKSRRGLLGWLGAGKDATMGRETEIEQVKHSPSHYDLVIIGCPIWNRRLPPAIRTYMKNSDFSKNMVAFFNTNRSNENQNTFSTMKELAKKEPLAKLVISSALKNREASIKKIEDWCEHLKSKI